MGAAQHVLVVDDEPNIRDLCRRYLAQHGYRVSTAASGEAMRKVLAADDVNLVILDLVLPGDDGLQLARQLRQSSDVGIIMLTSRSDLVDRVVGLEMGADDYVAKPFELRELLARVRSVLRRATASGEAVTAPVRRAAFAGWSFDVSTRQLTDPDGEEVPLTTAEFALLSVFVERPNHVLSRDRLLDLADRGSREPFDRSIDVQIHLLRRKIEIDPKRPMLIKTVRGAGYIFTPAVSAQ